MTWDTIAQDTHSPENPIYLLASRARSNGLINYGLFNYLCQPLFIHELLQDYETTTDQKRKVRIAKLLGELNQIHRLEEPIFVGNNLINPHG